MAVTVKDVDLVGTTLACPFNSPSFKQTMDNSLELGGSPVDSTSCDLEPIRSRVPRSRPTRTKRLREPTWLSSSARCSSNSRSTKHTWRINTREYSNCLVALFDSHHSVDAIRHCVGRHGRPVTEMCASMSSSVSTSSTSLTDRKHVAKNDTARLNVVHVSLICRCRAFGAQGVKIEYCSVRHGCRWKLVDKDQQKALPL